MKPEADRKKAEETVADIVKEIESSKIRNAARLRAIRRRYTTTLKGSSPEFMYSLAVRLSRIPDYRWFGYELLRCDQAAFSQLRAPEIEKLGRGINSWWTADAFARILSGPAWLNGQISGAVIMKWAHSRDFWWRRAALVSTVALNTKSDGGSGDATRTLRVCRVLAKDHIDMVVKGMSWALRALVADDPEKLKEFLSGHEDDLAPRVKREVRNKLTTGLKNPGKSNR